MVNLSHIQVLTKTELQEDLYSNTTLGESRTSGSLAINLDNNGRLAVSFLKDKSVMSAHRNLDTDGNALMTWTVEDTSFPSSSTTPTYLDSTVSPSKFTFLAALGQDNNIYVLDCSAKFPRWKTCSNTSGKKPTRLNIFTTKNDVLRIAVFMSNASVWTFDPSSDDKWSEDEAIKSKTSTVYDYRIGSAFTQVSDSDNSLWGYVVSGGVWGTSKDAGVALIAADQTKPTVRPIHRDKYTSLTYVAIAGSTPRTAPLVFGINQQAKVTYFQAQENGSFTPVLPFGSDSQFTYMDAIFRTGRDASGATTQWIDLYALDTFGQLWHTRNAQYDTGRFTAVKRLDSGDIMVPKWETPSLISSQAIKSFDITTEVDGAGHAYVVTELSGASSISLNCQVQDISSTDWTTSPIATVDRAEPTIVKRNIYYVELTVRKDGVIAPGLAARISAPDVSTSVASGQPYFTTTSARGLLCLTIPATASLSCPCLSVWVEGMDADHVLDVQPTGKIQERYAKITVDDLKTAKDQTDQSLVFSDLTNTQLEDLKKSLNQLGSSFKAPSNLIRSTYQHPKALHHVSATRQASDRHMGLVFHPTVSKPKPFRICLRPTFSVDILEHQNTEKASTTVPDNDSSWGDFWTQVINGVVQVKDMAFTPVADGVQAAVTYVVGGADKVWTGIAHFVRQAFDAIGELFKSLKVQMVKVFNWLAYIFAWDDIKATAVAFRGIIDNQIGLAESYIKNTIKTQLDTFFADGKKWVTDNKTSALTGSDKLIIKEYDKPESDPSNDLPSSSSWLSSKVDSSASSAGLDQVSLVNDDFTSKFQAFTNKLNSTGITADLTKALESASTFFQTLTSRGAIDKLTFKAFVQIFENLAVLLLDLGQAVMDTLIDVLLQALEVFRKSLDTIINIPIVSKIFKELVGLDLTLFNLIAVPMAVPVTVLYKVMVGDAPFPATSASSSDKTDSKKLDVKAEKGAQGSPKTDFTAVFSAIFAMVYGGTDILIDFISSVPKPSNGLVRILTYTNMFSSWLVLGTGVISKPTNARTRYAWDASIIGTVVTSMVVITDSANRKWGLSVANDQLMDVLGTLLPFAYGVAAFASGVWHIVNITIGSEPRTEKDWAIVVAELAGPIAGIAKIGKFAKNPMYTSAILPLIDYVAYTIAAIEYAAAA